MKKETFVMAIEAIKEQNKADSVFGENMVRCFPYADPTQLTPCNSILSNALLKVMQEATGDDFFDKLGCTWIEWWMWEADFGKTAQAWDDNKNPIPMGTAEELYDYLMSVRIKN